MLKWMREKDQNGKKEQRIQYKKLSSEMRYVFKRSMLKTSKVVNEVGGNARPTIFRKFINIYKKQVLTGLPSIINFWCL